MGSLNRLKLDLLLEERLLGSLNRLKLDLLLPPS